MTVIGRVLGTATAQRMMRLVPYALSSKGEGLIPVQMTELGVALPFATAFFYKAGSTQRTGEPHPISKLPLAIVEAAMTYGLIQHATGLFWILSLLLGAHNVGRADTQSDKLKAALNSAILFPTTYVLSNLSASWSDGLYHSDAKLVQEEYLRKVLKPIMANTHSVGSPAAGIKPLLIRLNRASNRLIKVFDSETPNPKEIRKLKGVFDKVSTQLVEEVRALNQRQVTGLGRLTHRTLLQLGQEMNISRFYTPLRGLNPIFGCLLATTVVGPLLANAAMRLVFPDTTKEASQDVMDQGIDSLWFDQMVGATWGPAAHTTFGPVAAGDGPAMARQLH